MSRYIDADAFDDTVQTLNEQGWNITRIDYKRMDRVLFEMPTADVVPMDFHNKVLEIEIKKQENLVEVKHGEWKAYNGDDSNWLRNDGSPVFMQCSECNTMVVNNFAFNWNFCPNCGAKMDERREDDTQN